MLDIVFAALFGSLAPRNCMSNKHTERLRLRRLAES
jgi:hypothetical protein